MAVRVLIVDDSTFYRRRLGEVLAGDADIEVVGTADNGREALQKARSLSPDVITMDYEMPMMDGITAVRQITAESAVPILMFSSLTHEGARVTLDALDAGASEFMPKDIGDLSRQSGERLIALVKTLAASERQAPAGSGAASGASAAARAPAAGSPQRRPKPVAARRRRELGVIVIGTSTGGPKALQQVLGELPARFSVPIVLIQHMPKAFTSAFAERLDGVTRLQVKEAQPGEALKPGIAYLAPGGQQLLLENKGQSAYVRLRDGDDRVQYKPSVDVTFGSAAKAFPGTALGIVLTGMGADGREGARLLKSSGSGVWVQDAESCVVAGMPVAVANAQLADEVIQLGELGARLLEETGGGSA